MKKYLILFLLPMLSLKVQLTEITPQNLLDLLDTREFIEAEFTQTTFKDTKERKIEGKIFASRAGKFKLIYLDPISEIISSDGKNLFRLDYELNQLDVFPLEEYFENMESPINFFTKSSKDLSKVYEVDYCEDFEEKTICYITPKTNNSFLEKLLIEIDINTIYSISYKDSFDQNVKLVLSNLSWKELNDDDFNLDTPPQIDVVYH